ncbi:hypothetical protein COCSUDRAFT_55951 [Coccomyxa subellipsoidea C-169]|uniref:BZIP domain-containing protein n=1 Tax=Coccomyxa subellipsoidea (strain C-169) TaxID=574566 RepID=I0YV36_COCSC|nr:hypothetical protein COCSUDRAFT_55951 [Coccomyxa subellipsoidea C-169]EIE22255.1 hypothetical protein COCSUDRAFT_55951 [Coccomyxa subellipsoidea C-169]|eukprot:XP_005646799.1 hypothetical protein COCSUDRAFT_55951 [Coccomyxa subellipsoidea C-169]
MLQASDGAEASRQESGSSGASGEEPHLRNTHEPNGALRQRGSNSGDECAKGIGVRKSGPDRDKNRAAQKAFRQRKREQEKAKELLVEELEAKLKAVQLEKARLEVQNSQLESALVARMKLAAHPNGNRVMAIDKGASGRVITGGHDWKCNLDWGPTDVLVLEHGEQQRLTPETVQALGLQGIAAVWKGYINKVAACLSGAWKDEDGPDGRKVQVLLSEAISVCAYMARTAPKILLQFARSRLEDNPLAPSAPSVALWKSCLKNMRLSVDQVAELLRRRRSFLMQLKALLEERTRIQATMKEQEMEDTPESVALRYFQLTEATKQLQSNVTALHDSKCRFFSCCWREVLRPVQGANLVVQAFPFAPDLLAVLSCLGAEAGEPSARDLLRAS